MLFLVKPFLLSPLPPSNVESTEDDLNAWHQHCFGGRGRRKICYFYGFIASMSQEFWPGLSENLFGRKLSFKLYEAWYFWGVKLGSYKCIVFLYPTLARPPKNVCNRDLELTKDRPFFTTSDAPLVLIKADAIDSLNTRMMNVRWRFYHFWDRIPQEEQQELIPRGPGFDKFILNNASDWETATTAWQVRFVTRVTPDHFSVTFLTHVSH